MYQPRKKVRKKCVECGTYFMTQKRNQRRCEEHKQVKKEKNPTVEKRCDVCGVKFSTSIKKKVFCSRVCKDVVWDVKKNDRTLEKQAAKLFKKHTVFEEHKSQYQKQLVDYDTPTGKAFIGLAKTPLMPNDNGIGYKGVLIQSENRALVQCSECGNWYKQLTDTHLKQHDMDTNAYREKFGLNLDTGLVSDDRAIDLADSIDRNVNKVGKRVPFERIRKKIEAGNRRVTKSGKRTKIKNTMQQYNRWGTCPEQLRAAVVEYVHRMHRLPTAYSANRGGFGKETTLRSRFGSLNNAFKEYGLPIRHRHRGDTEYTFPDGTVVFHKRGTPTTEIYNLMLEKCPILKEYGYTDI